MYTLNDRLFYLQFSCSHLQHSCTVILQNFATTLFVHDSGTKGTDDFFIIYRKTHRNAKWSGS